MALNIRNRHAEQLATDLAALTGESKTEALMKALKASLDQVKRRRRRRLVERLDEIAEHCASLPVLERRSPDELLYDERGLPR